MTGAGDRADAFRALGLPLVFEDDLSCPGLAPAAPGAGEVVTRVSRADPDAGWDGERAQTTRELRHGDRLAFRVDHLAGAGYRLEMPGAGVFRVDETGTAIGCAVTDGVEAAGVGLLTQAIPLAATLRGFEPFHAAGVVVDGRGALIGGPVGAGKSSLALHLTLGGASLLADDVVAVTLGEAGPLAHAGARQLRVREAEQRALPADLGPLCPVPGLDSRLQLLAPAAATPVPLRAIYLLARSAQAAEPISTPAVSGLDLLALTYNLSVATPERRLRQLDLCQALADRVAIRRAVVGPGTSAQALAAAVADDLRSR